MKKVMQSTVIAVLVLSLAGCSPADDPKVTAPVTQSQMLDADESAVADLALAKDEATRERRSETATVVDVYEWKEGYSVLVRTDGENPSGKYSNYHAYGYVRDSGSWTLEVDRSVSSDFNPKSEPEIAACKALADEYTEREACSATK